jgi:hypothetical protein
VVFMAVEKAARLVCLRLVSGLTIREKSNKRCQ